MSDALHPQTLLTYGMNDGDLPVSFGGPLRLRLPRQLGYKSVKFVSRVMVTDSLKGFVSALDPNSPNNIYSWYAGI
jgi:DMSO/TMAO reductase YedYZ molybdopterin-dependent catalytic subunit